LRRKKLYKRQKIEAHKAKKEARAKYDKVLSQYIKEKKSLHAKKEGEKHEEKQRRPPQYKPSQLIPRK